MYCESKLMSLLIIIQRSVPFPTDSSLLFSEQIKRVLSTPLPSLLHTLSVFQGDAILLMSLWMPVLERNSLWLHVLLVNPIHLASSLADVASYKEFSPFFFFFLQLNLQHMEVPEPGWDESFSCDLRRSHSTTRSKLHL